MQFRRYGGALLGVAILAGMYGLSHVSYLLFHTVVDMAGVVVGFSIFILAWNLRDKLDNGYLLMVGLCSAFIAALDLVHVMVYKGMGIFPALTADPPTQLWIGSRYLQSITLLVAPFLIKRRLPTGWLMGLFGVVTAGLLWSVFAGVFPACFTDGLTPFKIVSEYVIAGILAAGLWAVWRQRDSFDRNVLRMLTWFIALSIVAGMIFTLYLGVSDLRIVVGHLVRLASFYPLYQAMVHTGLTKPFNLLFYNLKQSEAALQQEKNFVASVLDSAGALMCVVDVQGRIVRFNQACQQLTGYAAEEVLGRSILESVIPADEAEHMRAQLRQMIAAEQPAEFEVHWADSQGNRRLVSWSAMPLRGENGQVQYFVGTGTDITERHQMEQELREREQRLRTMVESVKTGILMVDRATCAIVNANPAAAAMIGMPPESLIGRACSEFITCTGRDGTCPLVAGMEAPPNPVMKTAAGKQLPIHRTVAQMQADGRDLLLESFVDMTEHKRLEEELRQLSMLDELTGLYNRRGFMTLAEKEIENALRLNGAMALLYVDVNGLKEINDQRGHSEGDRTLVVMAKLLREAFHESGIIARIGGDEFVVLAPQFVGATPSLLVSRLNQYIEAYNCSTRAPYEIHVCTGVARVTPERRLSLTELLTQADTSMYVEKRRRAMGL